MLGEVDHPPVCQDAEEGGEEECCVERGAATEEIGACAGMSMDGCESAYCTTYSFPNLQRRTTSIGPPHGIKRPSSTTSIGLPEPTPLPPPPLTMPDHLAIASEPTTQLHGSAGWTEIPKNSFLVKEMGKQEVLYPVQFDIPLLAGKQPHFFPSGFDAPDIKPPSSQ